MEVEIQGYLTEFGEIRGQIRNALMNLNDDAANWFPLSEDTNSIYAILSHMIGSQDYWVRQVITGEKIQRDKEAEFHSSGSLSEILSRWEKNSSEIEEILGKLSLGQLAETRTAPTRPEPVTVRWTILHLISHNAIHLGHIQISRQLWGQQLS